MTDEQIEQNAKNFAINETGGLAIKYFPCERGYVAGAHSRDEEIEEWKESKRKLRLRLMHRISTLKKKIGETEEYLHIDDSRIADLEQEVSQLRNLWINVGDRLPTNQKQKIIMRKSNGKMYCGHYSTSLKCFMTVDPSVTKWTINDVTHWMPIPELKKEK